MKEKILKISKSIITHELISGSLYLFIGGTITNFLAFLYNVFLARTLVPTDYGVYVSLLSITTLMSVPVQSLSPIVVKFATEYFVKGEKGKEAKLYLTMTRAIILVSIAIFLGFLALAVPINDFLHINNVWYVVFVGGIIAFLYLGFVNNAFIQGFLKFSFFAFLNASGSLVKLLVGIVFILMGLRVFGAFGGIFVMYLTIFIIGFFPIKNVFGYLKNNNEEVPLKKIALYALPTIIAIFSLVSFTSTDVILVKHFFNSHDAGLYAGLSLIGKVIFYFTGMIPLVMFPLIVKRNSLGKKFDSLFYLSLLLVIIPSLIITGFYFLFPKFVISLFLGRSSYFTLIPYLGLFGIYLTMFSLLNVCVNFFLSLNKTKIAPLILLAAILQIVFISIFHSNFLEVIYSSLAICTSLVIALLIYYFYEKRKLNVAVASTPVENIPSA